MSKLVTIYGGSGFVGRYIARRMAKDGWRVRVAVRRPNDAMFVRPYGVPGGFFNEMYGWDSYFIVLGLLIALKNRIDQQLAERARATQPAAPATSRRVRVTGVIE